MRNLKLFTLSSLLILFALTGCTVSSENKETDTLFQVSTIDALLAGGFEGSITYAEIKKQGDFGLGTFHGLDGEMVALNGQFYQVKADGIAYPVADSARSPFAAVKFFKTDTVADISSLPSLEHIFAASDSMLPSPNLMYAALISGKFNYIKTRSVPAQTKPYPPISEIFENQPVFEFNEVRGDMIGFRFPPYAAEINSSGWHFHFVTEDRKHGGHVLEADLQQAKLHLDFSGNLNLQLPENPFFYSVDLGDE